MKSVLILIKNECYGVSGIETDLTGMEYSQLGFKVAFTEKNSVLGRTLDLVKRLMAKSVG